MVQQEYHMADTFHDMYFLHKLFKSRHMLAYYSRNNMNFFNTNVQTLTSIWCITSASKLNRRCRKLQGAEDDSSAV